MCTHTIYAHTYNIIVVIATTLVRVYILFMHTYAMHTYRHSPGTAQPQSLKMPADDHTDDVPARRQPPEDVDFLPRPGTALVVEQYAFRDGRVLAMLSQRGPFDSWVRIFWVEITHYVDDRTLEVR